MIERLGQVERTEMYRVFNMGVGFVIVVAPEDAGRYDAAPEATVVGGCVDRDGGPAVIVD